MRRVIVMVVGLGALLAACSGSEPAIELAEGSSGPDSHGFNPASPSTIAANRREAVRIGAITSDDEALAVRGFIGRDENLEIRDPDGGVDLPGEAPLTRAPGQLRSLRRGRHVALGELARHRPLGRARSRRRAEDLSLDAAALTGGVTPE